MGGIELDHPCSYNNTESGGLGWITPAVTITPSGVEWAGSLLHFEYLNIDLIKGENLTVFSKKSRKNPFSYINLIRSLIRPFG